MTEIAAGHGLSRHGHPMVALNLTDARGPMIDLSSERVRAVLEGSSVRDPLAGNTPLLPDHIGGLINFDEVAKKVLPHDSPY
jgi:hypothetical protein